MMEVIKDSLIINFSTNEMTEAEAAAAAGLGQDDKCWWFPTLEECVNPVDENEAMNKVVYTASQVMGAQLTYVMIASIEAAVAGLMAFRYRSGAWG